LFETNQALRAVADSDNLILNFFLQKAVDITHLFGNLSAASTEKPLETTGRKLKHFCSLKTE